MTASAVNDLVMVFDSASAYDQVRKLARVWLPPRSYEVRCRQPWQRRLNSAAHTCCKVDPDQSTMVSRPLSTDDHTIPNCRATDTQTGTLSPQAICP
jgi:hypothetical protein